MYDIIYISNTGDTTRFDALKSRYPHLRLLRGSDDLLQCLIKAKSMSYTEMFWLISDDVDLPDDADLSWKPPTWDRHYLHGWRSQTMSGAIIDGAAGVWLVPRGLTPTTSAFDEIKIADHWTSRTRPFDVFFMSYHEPHADANWQRLLDIAPNAKRVDGIKGISNAHRRCAELSDTKMFYTVDADTIVDTGWDFTFVPPAYDRRYLHVWHSRNPVNDLQYGWGGIKLWPRTAVLDFSGKWLDYTTTVGNIKILPDVISTSAFNTDPISAWRSGFREAVKLVFNIKAGDRMESLERLYIWMSVGNPVANADHSRRGAAAGMRFAIACIQQGSKDRAVLINDFDRLQELYLQHDVNQPIEFDKRTLLDSILDA